MKISYEQALTISNALLYGQETIDAMEDEHKSWRSAERVLPEGGVLVKVYGEWGLWSYSNGGDGRDLRAALSIIGANFTGNN